MALIGFEGFDFWNASNGTSTVRYTNSVNNLGAAFSWNSVFFNVLNAATLGGKTVQLATAQFVQCNFPTNSSGQLVVGVRFVTTTALSNNIARFLDSAAAVQCGLDINSSGKLIVWRGTTSTVLGTGTTTIVLGATYYFEIKIGFSNSANVEVRVNGVTDITLTGVDTTNTANQNCAYWAPVGTSGSIGNYDDFYILDTTGGAPYNDFLCGSGAGFVPLRVETLFATANNSVQWTPQASTNVSRIQETTEDGDTTYNTDSTAGHIDTYTHGSLTSTPSTIFAIKISSMGRKEDVTNRTFRNKLISNVTTVNGATYPLATVYQNFEDNYITDPDTGLAWANAAAVNNTKYGYELVT